MRRCSVRPDAYTFPAVLKVCGCAPGCRVGLLVHAEAVRRGLAADRFTVNALISFYCRIMDCRSDRKLFDEAGGVARDLVTWNSMVAGYIGCGEKGLAQELFDEMPQRDAFFWATLMDGYGKQGMAGADRERELFDQMPERDLVCWNSMIDGYARHGKMDEARSLFEEMPGRNVISWSIVIDGHVRCMVTWNVMIVGLGTHGYGMDAGTLFHRMEAESVAVDDLSVLGMLTACTHAGLVSEGLEIFYRMKRDFGMDPKVEHYGALVDLPGRAGHLDQARHTIETTPMEPTLELWGSLLAACRSHSCVELAELSVERLANLGADDSGVYVLLSNIYADEGM